MNTSLKRLLATSTWTVAVATLVAGCASTEEDAAQHEEVIGLAQMSAPARSTVERETAGGNVESIIKETERGRLVYDVEAKVGGKHLEFLIADSDGAVVGTETQIEFGQLPEPVRVKTEKFFGTTTGLTVMKGVEYGETSFEISGTKAGETVEVTFDPAGKRLE